jgi:hypothetical protein
MPELSQHALQRMRQRQIAHEDITMALKRRSGQPRPGDNGRIVILGYASQGRILRIVLTPDEQVIISVMWA